MQTINNRMTEIQMANLFSLVVQLQIKAEESNDCDTTILAYSIQNACSNLTEFQREFRATDATIHDLRLKLTGTAVQLANAESKRREPAAGLSAVDKTYNEAIFITNDRYEQCPPEAQDMIRSLAVLQVPTCQALLAEVQANARNEGVSYAASRLAATFNNSSVNKPLTEVCDMARMILDAEEELTNSTLPAADGISGEYAEKFLAEFSSQLHREAAL